MNVPHPIHESRAGEEGRCRIRFAELAGSANAVDPATSGLPPDAVPIGIALTLLVLTGLLQDSLGDVAGDEAQLPSSISLINKSRQKRSSFLKKK